MRRRDFGGIDDERGGRFGDSTRAPLRAAAAVACEALENRVLFTGDQIGTATPSGLGPGSSVVVSDQIPNNPLDYRDRDLWRVTLNAGEVFTAHAHVTGTFPGDRDTFRTVLRLFRGIDNDSGTQVGATAYPSGANTDLTFVATFSGFYYIGVSGYPNDSYNPNNGNATGVNSAAGGTYNLTLTRNRPPVANPDGPPFQVLEDNGLSAGGLLNNDSDPDGNPIAAFNFSDPPHGGFFALSGNGSFGYLPDSNYFGGDTFTYQAIDSFGAVSAPATVSINVIPVNDAPSFSGGASRTVNEDAPRQTVPGWATNLSAGPANEAGQALTFLTSGYNPALFEEAPAIDSSGTLTFKPAKDANGSTTVTVLLRDNGGTANGGVDTSSPYTFTITINPVNDAPNFFLNGNPPTVPEDAGPQAVPGFATLIRRGPATATDEASQALTFVTSVTGTTGNLAFTAAPAISAAGTLTYAAAADTNGTATVAVHLVDNGGTANGGVNTSPAQFFTISVAAVNDAPRFALPPAGPPAALEDAGPVTVPAFATGIAPGPAAATDELATQAVGFLVTNDNNALFSTQPSIDPATGALTYTPAPDANGSATVTARLRDDGGTANGGVDTSATQTFTIFVTPVNDAPRFVGGPNITADEDAGPQSFANWATNLGKGPADESGQALGFLLGGYDPALFAVAPAIDPSTGALTFTPARDANGSTTVTALLRDNGGTADGGVDAGAPYTFTITVNPVNDRPVAADDCATTGEDNAAVVSVLANDRPGPVTAVDEAGQRLRVTAINGTPVGAGDSVRTLHGSARLNDDGTTITYTPDADYNGDPALPAYDDTFTYTATDDGVPPEGADGSGRVYINPVNDRPVALPPGDGPVSLDEDTTRAIQLRGDDGDPEVAQALTYVIVRQPTRGVLKNFDPATGYVEYEPAADYFGPDSFAFAVRDDAAAGPPADLESDPAEVNLYVNPINDAPVARPDPGPYAVDEDSGPLAVAAPGVLANDGDADDALISAVLVRGPAHAKHFLLGADGSFVYEPEADFDQTDSFTYRAFDGKDYSDDEITVSVRVNPVNDAPVIDRPVDDRQANEGEELVFTVTARDADTGDRLTYSLVDAPGGATIDPDTGVFRWTPGEAQGPNSYQFTVRVTDSGSPQGADEVPVTVSVNEVNRRPTLGPIDAEQQALEGHTLTFTATAADPDLPANELFFSLEGAPRGAAIDAHTGVFTWTPEEDQDGTHSFFVKVTDNGSTALSDSREVTVTVGEVNRDPRLSAPSSVTVDEHTDVSAALVGADDDIVGGVRNTLTYSIESGGLSGMVLDPATGAFAWTPSENQDGSYEVTFKVDDGRGGVARTTVQFLVREVNADPSLAPVADAAVDELATLTFTASASDVDLVGGTPNAMRYSLIDAPAGAVIDAETGEFTWTPTEADGPGSYTFKVRVTDDGNAPLFDEDEITVTVREANVAPTLSGVPAAAAIDEGVPYTFTASAADVDLPGQALVFSLVGANVPAGAAIDPNTGVFTWTPAEGQAPGVYDFAVRVSDGVADTDAPVRLTAREVNAAPVLALIDRQYADEGGVVRFQASATDPDLPANTLRFSLGDGAPAGATIDPVTGAFSWTPPDSGVYTLTVRVADDGSTALGDEQTVTVEVRNLDPTVVNVFNDGPRAEGSPVTVTIEAADAGGAADPLNYEFDFDNDGVYEVGPQPGNSAAHVFADNGAWAVGYRVTDGDGGVTTGVTQVATTNANPQPAIVGAPATAGEGAAIQLAASVSDPGADDTSTFAWAVTKNGSPYAGGTGDTFAFTPDDDGDYVVTLTATDDDGGVGATSQHITVTNVAPTADAGDDFAVDEGSAASFSAISFDPGAADTFTYQWHVVGPNGQAVANGTDKEFSFVPGDDGAYAVTLTVADDDGGGDSETVTVTARNVAPSAAITGAPAQSPEGTEIVLGSTAGDPAGANDPLTYAWSVTKNGNPYSVGGAATDQPGFRFTPDDDGTYVVRLTVGDDDGGSITTSETIAVTNVAPLGVDLGDDFAADEGQAVGLTTAFTDPGSADAHTFHWHVESDNGQVIADGGGGAFTFTPDDNGAYTVTVTVTDDDGAAASDTVVVTSNNVRPAVAITGAPGGVVPEGSPITLGGAVTDAGSADTHTYAWGVTKNGAAYAAGAGADFTFTPDDDGTYVATLTATDDDGDTSDPASRTITVGNVAPVAAITGAPASSPEGATINLGNTVSDPAGANDAPAYAWSVTKNGVGYGAGTGSTFGFTPDDDGSYVVTLTVDDGDGGADTRTQTITVTNVAPRASITGAPASITEGGTVTVGADVSDAGAADAHAYAWSVTKNGAACGTGGNGVGFAFTPDDDGTYVLALTVTDDDGGRATDVRTIEVGNAAPVAGINGAPAGATEGDAVAVQGTVADPGSADTHAYAWGVTRNGLPYALPAGAVADAAGFAFAPADDGTYVVTLVVTDDDGGTGTASATVAVANANPAASIAGAPASSPEGAPIALTGSAADAGAADALALAWTVTKNGAPYAAGPGAGFTFTPDDDGVYVVTLTATDDDGGVGTDVRTVNVGNVAPNGSILGAPASAPEGAAVSLSASASDAGSADVLYYAWTVTKDGTAYASGAGSDFSFMPNDDGTYAVTLVVTDDDGASVTGQRIVAVTNVAPSVALAGPSADYVTAVGAVVPFRGTFDDPGSADTFTATWTFTPATGAPIVVTRSVSGGAANLDYAFAAAGVYQVRLTVTDDDGGAGTAAQVGGFDATVVVYDPTAGYVAGNGHIDSPAGAYADDPSWSGKASFHFLSQYEKGKTVPTGDTVFSFKTDAKAGFEFVSTAYEWMVISGSRVQYKGSGSVNGVAGYRFILTAIDGDADGTKQDKFRIRIWRPEALGGGVVYDNQRGSNDDAAPTTVIAGGSINIKRDKSAGAILP